MTKTPSALHPIDRPGLYRTAYVLALITIFYNVLEGLVSVFFGIEDETVSLLGFGIDSFVEVVSGIGIWHMVKRIRAYGDEVIDRFERQALRVTGTAFYLLTAGLALTAAVNLYQGHSPRTAFWGVVVALVSIFSMWALIHFKTRVGTALGSQAILADAACTRACMQLSAVLLLASAGYQLTGIGWLDSAGALLIAVLTFREGRESFEKSRRSTLACCCGGSCGQTPTGIGEGMPDK